MLESQVNTGTFTSELWESITGIYAAILEHPFLRGLTEGSLPEASFRYYVTQDSLYLRDFARCLAMGAAKAPRDAWCDMLAEHARVALTVEQQLHEGFFKDWGLDPDQVQQTPLAPTNLAYTSYILRVAYSRPFEELIGALLPCYWIYWEVGKTLEAKGSPNRLFQRWIDTYASEQFGTSVQHILEVANQVTADLSEARLDRVRQHFITGSRYEWMFWDAAFKLEPWPV